jgi:HD-GYP domain-containing protein (c-di-GMP phosphodiesterase class II)
MKLDGADIESVPLDEILADTPCAAGLYLLLPKNKRLIPLVHQGDALDREKLTRLMNHRYHELWRFRVSRDAAAVQSQVTTLAEEARTSASLVQAPDFDGLARKPGAILLHVRDTLSSIVITEEETASALKAVSQSVLKLLSNVHEGSGPATEEVAKTCRTVVDEVLRIASEESDIYTQILALRQANSDLEHSTAVGTMAVMFALSLGIYDQALLNDLATAALFHDIGVSSLPAGIAIKRRENMTPEERVTYFSHVEKSKDTLRAADLPLRKRVYDLISNHHLNYDGSGFPPVAGRGDEATQILALADRFDELCDKGAMNATDALNSLYKASTTPGGQVVASPELMERIFQFMEQEHTAAQAARETAEQAAAGARKRL